MRDRQTACLGARVLALGAGQPHEDPHLIDGKAKLPRPPDEAQPRNVVRIVAPKPAARPVRRWQQTPRCTRFGSPLVLSRVHWVRPEMVVEVSYAEWTPDGLDMLCIWASARISQPKRCAAAHPTSARRQKARKL